MKSAPFVEKALLVHLNNPDCLASIGHAHVMVLPQRRRCVVVAEPYQNFATAGALNVDVRRLMFTWRRIDIHAKGPFLVYLNHCES